MMCHYHVVTVGASTGSDNMVFENENNAKRQYASTLANIRHSAGKEKKVEHLRNGEQKAIFGDGSVLRIYPCDSDCLEIIYNED